VGAWKRGGPRIQGRQCSRAGHESRGVYVPARTRSTTNGPAIDREIRPRSRTARGLVKSGRSHLADCWPYTKQQLCRSSSGARPASTSDLRGCTRVCRFCQAGMITARSAGTPEGAVLPREGAMVLLAPGPRRRDSPRSRPEFSGSDGVVPHGETTRSAPGRFSVRSRAAVDEFSVWKIANRDSRRWRRNRSHVRARKRARGPCASDQQS